MPVFVNKKTKEEKVFSKIRVYINDDLTKRTVDLVTGKEIGDDWVAQDMAASAKNIVAKKAPRDGRGTR